ncbi:hypothetical protein AEST_12040 [Alishewanella aestuarii B11]|uniref:Uncharacterized protein n=1 Tax=Alishewanella aestuarii B11 TaxID=1197174 RepID=J2IFX9_9ALTE|nr:hypothetical protein AEST_12040 [Alishewanella aestuarii B11]
MQVPAALSSRLSFSPIVSTTAAGRALPAAAVLPDSNVEQSAVVPQLSLASRLNQAKDNAAAPAQQLSDERKTQARERIADIKKRLHELKRLLALFGERAAKPLLQQVQQLSRELASAAKDLRADSNDPLSALPKMSLNSAEQPTLSSGTVAISQPSAASSVAVMAQEPTINTVSADSDSEETQPINSGSHEPQSLGVAGPAELAAWLQREAQDPVKQQRQADKQQLDEVVIELGSFFRLLSLILERQRQEPQVQKQQQQIADDLELTASIARELGCAGNTVQLRLHITV